MENDFYEGQPEGKSEIVTIMLIDIAGYTKKTSNMPRASLNRLQEIFDSIAMPLFRKFSGRVVKKMGDAFLVTFRSATDSLLCGIELQKAFHYFNKGQPMKSQLHIRVVLHTGEVVHRQGDIYGDAVNTTARVEGMTKADHIVFTGSTYLAMNQVEIPYFHLGQFTFKGIKNPVRLFRVKGPYEEIKRRIIVPRQRSSTTELAAIILIVLIAVALLCMYYYSEIIAFFS